MSNTLNDLHIMAAALKDIINGEDGESYCLEDLQDSPSFADARAAMSRNDPHNDNCDLQPRMKAMSAMLRDLATAIYGTSTNADVLVRIGAQAEELANELDELGR